MLVPCRSSLAGARLAGAALAVTGCFASPPAPPPPAVAARTLASGPDSVEHRSAAEWIAWISEPDAPDATWAERSLAAARAFPALGDDAVAALVATLASDKAWVREYAAYRLGDLGDRAVPAMPKLLAALDDPESYLVVEAGSAALGNLAMASDKALAWLIETAERGPAAARIAVIGELGHLGGRATNALPALRRIAAGPDTEPAAAAREAIEEILATTGSGTP